MRNKLTKLTFIIIALAGFTKLSAQQELLDQIDVDIFPKPEKGLVQYVINLPYSSMEDINNKKIEIYVGKTTKAEIKCHKLTDLVY